MTLNTFDLKPAGYAYLLEKLDLAGMPNWHRSWVATSGAQVAKVEDGFIDEVYRSQYWPGEHVGSHLEFALKYDGVHLGLLARIFEKISREELIAYIQSKPTGKYARRIWFFYEFLTGKRLPLADVTSGNYVDALNPKTDYTVLNGEKSPRHRVVNNLLGTKTFCPVVRRTERLSRLEASDLYKQCDEKISGYPPELLRRALSYLYNKETKSSFEIEHITPGTSRTEKFMSSLALAEKEDFCVKERLIALQNRIVDPRFAESDYRDTQNYVGQTVSYRNEIVHFIGPKPEDLPDLMTGLIAAHQRMKAGEVSPVVHAAAIAYGFVFLHPFEDGNGRIHRFLIHNILSLRKTLPPGIMFPVSAVMLKNPEAYDASLEAFSRPLLSLVEYRLDRIGKMTVENDTACWYRHMDMTTQAEALYGFVIKTIEDELADEFEFLIRYDKTRKALREILDLPDRMMDLFIQLCLQNNGRLSVRKKRTHFDFLTDEEIASMEQAVQAGYNRTESPDTI